MTSFLFFVLSLAHAGRYAQNPVQPFLAFEKKIADNCRAKLVRPDHLSQLELWFPDAAPAFRRAFVWMGRGKPGATVLLGHPRLSLGYPPFFVVVPLGHAPDVPMFILNYHERRAPRMRVQVRRLHGQIHVRERMDSRVENGIRYPANSVDVSFFDRPGTAAVRVDEAMRMVTREAEALGRVNPHPDVVRPE